MVFKNWIFEKIIEFYFFIFRYPAEYYIQYQIQYTNIRHPSLAKTKTNCLSQNANHGDLFLTFPIFRLRGDIR